MLNCDIRLADDPAGLAERMASLLDLDNERVTQWLLARCVQESIDQPRLAAVAARLAQTTSTANNRPAQTAGAKLKLSADDNGALAFKQKQLSAKSGTVTLLMDDPNTTGEQHGIAVEGRGVDKDGPSVGPGQTSTVTVTLKPGKYTFYCPVPGHKAASMTGILTIT